MSVLKVFAIGRLGRDLAEIRYTQNGKEVLEFSLATNYKVGGEDKVEWLNCVCYGKTAEIVKRYLGKGSQVFIEGTLRTQKWTDKLNVQHSKTKVPVMRIQFLGQPRSAQDEQPPEEMEPEPGWEG